MKVVVFGATGMVGQGVLRECLLDARVDEVVSVGRSPLGTEDPKFTELLAADLTDISALEPRLAGADACFFCLGVSSVGMAEADYRRVTHDLTLSIAEVLGRVNPAMTFVYVSGAGTDSVGRAMWARVKGETENALFALPFDTYALRPGYIQPTHGTRSKTRLYRTLYRVAAPLYPLLRRVLPGYVTTNENLGKAMIALAVDGDERHILDNDGINELAG